MEDTATNKGFIYHSLRLAGHAFIGALTGLFILHPASRVFHLVLTAPGDFSLGLLIRDLMVLEHHVTMYVYFTVLGAVAGIAHGLYAQRVFRLSTSLADSAFTAAVSGTYRRLFEKDIPEEPDAGETGSIPPRMQPRYIQGTAVSLGRFTGPAYVRRTEDTFRNLIQQAQTGGYSADDFEKALAVTASQLKEFRDNAVSSGTDDTALIFEAHLMVLRDQAFTGAVRKQLSRGESVSEAVLRTINRYIDGFATTENLYMRDKVHDLRDIVIRLLRNLTGGQDTQDCAGRVVVGSDITPSDMLRMAAGDVGGVVLLQGGINSHTAIIARSLRVPTVLVGPEWLPETLPDGTHVMVDGYAGTVCLNPSAADNAAPSVSAEAVDVSSGPTVPSPAVSADGTAVTLMANINILADLQMPAVGSCDGVGLYRTEFSFINYGAVPAEDEQYPIYRQVVERAPGGRVVFRAFDLGGDKEFRAAGPASTPNPLLGLRSTRFLLRNRGIFRSQMRAILRACRDVPARILFPMVLSADDYREARSVVDECVRELRQEGVPHATVIMTGVMAEAPAVIGIIDDLCRETDFISLGTNDLIQYLLAVDRSDASLAGYYLPHHPSVLRAVRRISEAAERHGKPLTVCGDMAADTMYLPFLIGTGIRSLSVEPARLDHISAAVGRIDVREAEKAAAAMLAEGTVRGVDLLLRAQAAQQRAAV